MNRSILAISTCALAIGASALNAYAEPPQQRAPTSTVQPANQAFPGEIRLTVDARDSERRMVHVRETITGVGQDCVLLHPKSAPGMDGVGGPIDRLTGLALSASGNRLAWERDPVDPYAVRVKMPPGVHAIDVQFDYLSPMSPQLGGPEFNPDVLVLAWNEVLLYPAGYPAARIPVDASVTLPDGWAFATPLQTAMSARMKTDFKRVSLESLVDNPIYAGRHWARNDLGSVVPTDLNLFAARPESLEVQPTELERTCCP